MDLITNLQFSRGRTLMDVSFADFFQQLASSPALLVTSLLTLSVIFVNGWTDAPNAIATCITTRCLRPRPAILMSAGFNFLGVLIMTKINASVASTISNMVDFGTDTHTALIALSAALFSIVVYSTAASHFGIPTSESHSLIAGLSSMDCSFLSSLDSVQDILSARRLPSSAGISIDAKQMASSHMRR